MVDSKGNKLVFISLFILLLSCFPEQIKAFEALGGGIKEVKGYYLDLHQQKRVGYFLLPIEYLNQQPKKEIIQWKIIFVDEAKIEWEITPANIHSFTFQYKKEIHHYEKIPNLWKLKNPFRETSDFIFCRILSKGIYKLYEVEIKGSFNNITFTDVNGTAEADGGSSFLNKSIELIFAHNNQFILLHPINWRNLVKPFLRPKGHELPRLISKRKFIDFLKSINQKKQLQLL